MQSLCKFLDRPMNFLGRGSSWVATANTCSDDAPPATGRPTGARGGAPAPATAVDCCVFSHENAHFQVLKRTFNGSEHENRFHRASTNHRSEVSDAERSNISNNNGLKFRLRLSHERGNTRNFLLQMRKFLWKSRNSLYQRTCG